MNDEWSAQLVRAINSHGDGLGTNLVYLKKFLAAQQQDQQKFLAEQRQASDNAQRAANRAAIASAVAAVAAAIAAGLQAWDALKAP